MMYKLIKIYNFFTKHNPKAQDDKLDEEHDEHEEAYQTYKHSPNRENFMALLAEYVDEGVLLFQKAIVEYGLNMDEIESYYKMKVERTIKLIEKCNGDPENYEKVRKYER